jgi:3-methyl-2-oxobutanoate hydroxymethyltransferase
LGSTFSGAPLSKLTQKTKQVTIADIAGFFGTGRKISMVTCYDSSFARLVEKSDVDMVLVGDSLGNVMLGYDNTIPVTMDDMLHHCKAVSRVLMRPFICGDMPFLSYQVSTEQAVRNAGRLIQEGGCHGVKVEGGRAIAASVAAIVNAGIPVMGHLGLTPQSIHKLGGYKVQARSDEARRILLEDAEALAKAGAFSLVLEMVPRDLAKEVTAKIGIPTIGIGAGPDCSGQVLVLQDMLGFDSDFNPKFLKKYLDLGGAITNALNEYHGEVTAGQFPAASQSFSGEKH